MVLLNALVLTLVYYFCQGFVGLFASFLICLTLLVTNQFWFTSEYCLNPHLLPILTFGLVFGLFKAYKGKKQGLIIASFCTGFVLHSELAFFPVAFLTLVLFSGLIRKKFNYSLKILLKPTLILFFFFLPHLISEFSSNFLQIKSVIRQIQEPRGVIGALPYLDRLKLITNQFMLLFSRVFIPQAETWGIIVVLTCFILLSWAVFKKKLNKNYLFILKITLLLLILSWFWFSLSQEFLSWHILGVYPLVLVMVLTGLLISKNKLAGIVFSLIVLSQIINFIIIYPKQVRISSDQGILSNQLNAIDWIYQEAEGKGFYFYDYINYVYDYQYQYLVFWKGINGYGYLPCEYSTFPNTPSSLYFPPLKYYQQPQRECGGLYFLLIEPTLDKQGFDTWHQKVIENTALVKRENFGEIIVEKRIKPGYTF